MTDQPRPPARPGPRPGATTTPAQLRGALKAYRVMAITSGIALFILVGAMILRYGPPQNESFSRVWSPIHGAIYFAYAVSIGNLALKAKWPLLRMVGNMLTGFVPVLPFIAEPRVAHDTLAKIADLEAGRPLR